MLFRSKKGYQISNTMQVKKEENETETKKKSGESKIDFFQDIVNRDKKKVKLTRFSFDVRA